MRTVNFECKHLHCRLRIHREILKMCEQTNNIYLVSIYIGLQIKPLFEMRTTYWVLHIITAHKHFNRFDRVSCYVNIFPSKMALTWYQIEKCFSLFILLLSSSSFCFSFYIIFILLFLFWHFFPLTQRHS